MILAASTAELTLRMVVSLAFMGGVVLVAMKLVRGRLRLGAGRHGITVHSRQQLTKASSVAVIRAGERFFLVGVSDQSVTLLAEGDDLAAGPMVPADDAPPETGPVAAGPDQAAAPGANVLHRPRDTKLRSRRADGQPKGGARRRHRRASGSVSSRMSVIEALREKTVRRS
jgi:flagellar protein FliO/FliZ